MHHFAFSASYSGIWPVKTGLQFYSQTFSLEMNGGRNSSGKRLSRVAHGSCRPAGRTRVNFFVGNLTGRVRSGQEKMDSWATLWLSQFYLENVKTVHVCLCLQCCDQLNLK